MNEVLESLADGNPDALIRLKSLFLENRTPSGMTSTPFLNSLGKKLGNLLRGRENPMEIISTLWNTGERDYRLVAISALSALIRTMPDGVLGFASGVVCDIDNWEICDQMALRVMGPLAARSREQIFGMMEEWLESENRWLRRLAVATIPPYIRRRKEDARFCLYFLRRAMDERDGEVIKAIGWALREVSKKDSGAVFRFLLEFSSTTDRYRRRIIREGMKKLPVEYQKRLVSILEKNG